MPNGKYMNDIEMAARDDVARQIRELRKETGMTLQELGDKSFMSPVHLCETYREDGYRVPSFRSMIRVFNALGLKEVTIKWG